MKKICRIKKKKVQLQKVNLDKPTSVMPSVEVDSSTLPATREVGAPSFQVVIIESNDGDIKSFKSLYPK